MNEKVLQRQKACSNHRIGRLHRLGGSSNGIRTSASCSCLLPNPFTAYWVPQAAYWVPQAIQGLQSRQQFASAAHSVQPAGAQLSPTALSSRGGNKKRAAFAMRVGREPLYVLEKLGVEALLANSHFLTKEESVR